MAGEDPRVAVNKVTKKPVPAKRRTKQKKYKQPPETNDQQDKCGKCGYRPNKPQEKCPATNEPWNKCNKLGHFAQLSTSQKNRVNSLNEEVYPNNAYSSDNEEYVNVHLLCKASLEMNGIVTNHTAAMKMNGGRLWKWVAVPYDVSWKLARMLMSLTSPNYNK